MEALMNCLTSNASQTLIMLKEFSSANNSLPSFSTPNLLKTGNELKVKKKVVNMLVKLSPLSL